MDIAAPGAHIYTTTLGGGTGYWSGTSFSSPFVAGAAAVVAGQNPTFSPDRVEQQLEATARDLGAAGRDTSFGSGRLDLASALGRKGPAVTSAGFGNDIAYRLKSMLSARLSYTADAPGCTAVLRVHTPNRYRVYAGTSGAAGTPSVLGPFDGKGWDGAQLPTGNYRWDLTVTKSGLSTTVSGAITVSQVWFRITGDLANSGTLSHNAYMISGPATFYVACRTSAAPGSFKLVVKEPNGIQQTAYSTTMSSTARFGGSGRLTVRQYGIHTLNVTATKGVSYTVTVVE